MHHQSCHSKITLALGHLPDVDTTDAHPQASLSFHSHYETGVYTQLYVPLCRCMLTVCVSVQMHADSVRVCADAC